MVLLLYKQLVLIKQYRQENDLIDYLYKRIKSYEDEIKVLGNGLKYIFPEEEISFWNYHSSGLQIHSPYIKNLTKNYKHIQEEKNSSINIMVKYSI